MTKRHRDATTGEFTTAQHAAEHPDTTVSETVKPRADLREWSKRANACADLLPAPGPEALREALAHLDAALDERDHLAAQVAEKDANPRDEHHTMAELYEYRMLYNALAANLMPENAVKSWRHSDGEECFGGGWFIVSLDLPTGQVSNHYRAEHWGLFAVPEAETAPEWDGHTPAVAAERLRAFRPSIEPSDEEVERAAKEIWRWFVGDSLDGFYRRTYAYDREKCMDAARAALRAARGLT